MYTDEERLETFYHECGNYYTYQYKVKSLKDQLETLTNRYENTHSPVLDRISIGAGDINKDKIICYLNAKTKLSNRIEAHEKMMAWVQSCIDAIVLPAYKVLVWQTCIQGYKLSALATKYDVSLKHISTTRKKCLLQVLTNAKMQEYDDLQMALIDAETQAFREHILKEDNS